jgi:NADP-dependent 3-hydroxy acid dehydrogenase YdfG
LPNLQLSKTPQIINISSIAGKEVYPKGNVYCASKFGVEALSQAMRLDFLDLGIRVTNIAPGLVNTNFSKIRFKGDIEKANKVYEGIEPLVANDIAETILFVLSRPYHVQIADITILAGTQASATVVKRK